MTKKTEIKINLEILKFIFFTILISFIFTLIIEHFGEFKFSVNWKAHDSFGLWASKVEKIKLHTPFANILETDGKGYTARDIYNDDPSIQGKFFKNYLIRFPFYLKAVLVDIIYPIFLTIITIGIYFFRRKFKIQFMNKKCN